MSVRSVQRFIIVFAAVAVLYLNYSKRVQRLWEQDIPGNIARGLANRPAVLNK